jgi:N-acetylmuramoyl-L-alanine amidase
MVLAGTVTAVGQSQPAEVAFGHLGVLPERAIRVGDEAFVPLPILGSMAWKHHVQGATVFIQFGSRNTEAPIRTFGERKLFPLRQVVDALGGTSEWSPTGDRLDVMAKVESIEANRQVFRVETSWDIKPSVFVEPGTKQTVVDVFGARLTDQTKRLLEDGAVAEQIRPGVVRVTIPTDFEPEGIDSTFSTTKRFAWTLRPAKQTDIPESPTKDDPASIAGSQTTLPVPVPLAAPVFIPVVVDPPMVVSATDREVRLSLKIQKPLSSPPEFRRLDARTLEVVLPRAVLVLPESFSLQTEMVNSATARMEGTSAVLTLTLKRPLGVQLNSQADRVNIQFLVPKVGDGKLAGKVIVVDPGHGGRDSGAVAPNRSVFEKNLALNISKAISRALQEHGATVILTRDSDVFIPLKERSAIANRNRAEFFLSVHINSNRVVNSARGIITFYHGGRSIDQAFADSLHRELIRSTKMPDRKVLSDRRIYTSGFAVLRNSTMPAVLLELGFINHQTDRARMTEPTYAAQVAQGVVQGFKVFLGNE